MRKTRTDGRRDGRTDGGTDGRTDGHDDTIIRTVFKKRSYKKGAVSSCDTKFSTSFNNSPLIYRFVLYFSFIKSYAPDLLMWEMVNVERDYPCLC